MKPSFAKTFLDQLRAEKQFREEFGSIDTKEQAEQAEQKYQEWLKTPEATQAILIDPWKATLSLKWDPDTPDADTKLKQMIQRLKHPISDTRISEVK